MTKHAPVQHWDDGELLHSSPEVERFDEDLKMRLSGRDVLRDLDLLGTANKQISDDELWPRLRIAYEAGLFSRIPANGLPPVSYPLSDDVDLERAPPGSSQPLPRVRLKNQPVTIAGLKVDFPLGLPASVISANASYLKYYSERGFDILTYKTVRSRFHPAHPHPQWVFLEDASQLNLAELVKGSVQTLNGRQRFFPVDRSKASMANSFGIPSHDPKWWMEDIAYARTFIKRGRQVLIVSVMSTVGEDSAGEIKRDFVGTADKAKEVGADIIELNFSCPNTKERSGDIYNHPEDAAEIARAVKFTTKLPIFIKIGFLPEEHLQQLVCAVSPYIDGIVAINTVSAPVKDQFGNEMFPGRSKAGTSGWIIQQVAHEVAKNLVRVRDQLGRRDTLDLLGLGGVMTKEDFWARLNTGVNAVEICTGAFLDPLLGFKIRQATSVADPEREQNHDLGDDRAKVQLQRPEIAGALPSGGGVASVSNKTAELPLNGGDWERVSSLLTRHRTVKTIARDAHLSDPEVEELLKQHSDQIRTSLINAENGNTLYIRKDTGILPRLREILAIVQLAAM